VDFAGPTGAHPAQEGKREMAINIVNVEPKENILKCESDVKCK
jgi:hypothetical protein